jgi:hypothetical protein
MKFRLKILSTAQCEWSIQLLLSTPGDISQSVFDTPDDHFDLVLPSDFRKQRSSLGFEEFQILGISKALQ